jgi:hypothetical protein
LQVKHLERTPLVLVGAMWPGLLAWARAAMLDNDPPLASAEDLDIPRCVANSGEAVALIREAEQRWRRERSSETPSHHR